jgi:hypothetical protein
MIREHALPLPLRRSLGPVVSTPQANGASPPARPRLVALTAGIPSGGLEAAVIARLLEGDPLGTLAILTAEALQAAPNGAAGSTAAEVRGVAARIATGLAVTLLESDLAERITARLAEEAPFAEGWRSCPE